MRRDYIAGIYNTCDYWCDRCAFTRRCRNFQMGEELEQRERRKPASDEENQARWDSVDAVLGEARKRLDDLAAERFDDLLSDVGGDDDPEEVERFMAEQDARDKVVRNHFVVKATTAYMRAVSEWLESAAPDVKEATDRLVAQARFTAEAADARDELERLEDDVDIVAWYHTLLPPKAHRMISGLLELPKQDAWNDGSDVAGTGKLLLVSIDRSLAAWTHLLSLLPDQEMTILGLMIRLDHLRRGIERAVPRARAFIRPGLDEPASPE